MNKNPLDNVGIPQYVDTDEWSWKFSIPKEGIPKPLSLEDFQLGISKYFTDKEPDIVVFSDDNIFSVTINKRLRTGKGGLRMYLKGIPDSIPLKVSFNGVILSEEQYKQFKQTYGK